MKGYIVEVDKGSWDDWGWGIAGIYDCPFKADNAKQLLLAKYDENKQSKDWIISHFAKSDNSVSVKEQELNEPVKCPFGY